MKMIKKVVATLLMMSIVPLCTMETKKSNVKSDEDLLAKKKAFALELEKRKKNKWEWLHYPKDQNVETELKAIDIEALNKELGLRDFCGVSRLGCMFLIPAGMDEKFIHKTLVPSQRVPDFEVGLI
jgi:hypothetical protein